MKRTAFIVIGIVLVLALIAVWVYVLFFGSPSNNNAAYTDLNFGDTTDTALTTSDTATSTSQPTIDVNGPERLRQLTTKPVAGYQEVLPSDNSVAEVFYIEQGTGHIFSINLISGEEKRISGTTIKESVSGAITPNGRFTMIQSGRGVGSEVIVGEISSTTEAILSQPMTEEVVDFIATEGNTFLYAAKTGNSLIGKEYFPISDTSETLFTIPFREAAIDWGSTAASVHYAYPKANSQLEGFAYQIKNGQTKRLPIDGYGLSVAGNDTMALYSKQIDGEYKTFVYSAESSASSLGLTVIPEKCTAWHQSEDLLCAETITLYSRSMPDDWYKGSTSFADGLWNIELINDGIPGALLIVDTKKNSGRELDIIDLVVNTSDTRVYFTNKNDMTLWLYELTIPEEDLENDVAPSIN